MSSVIRQNFYSFQNNPKSLQPSYKMDLDLLDCFRRVKLIIIAEVHMPDSDICSHARERKTASYSRINTVLKIWRL